MDLKQASNEATNKLLASPTPEEEREALYGLLEASESNDPEIRVVLSKVVSKEVHPVLAYGYLLERFPSLKEKHEDRHPGRA